MEKLTSESKALMEERFGRDSIIALATMDGERPYVRYVNAYYEDGAFYVITYGLSNKMRQLKKNDNVVYGKWKRSQSWLFWQGGKCTNRRKTEKRVFGVD